MTKHMIAGLAVLVTAASAYGTPGDTLWTETYGSIVNENINAMQQTSDGGYILAGSTGAGGSNVYLVKTDEAGVQQWDASHGDSGYQTGRSVQETADGGYIVAGSRDGVGEEPNDVHLVRFDDSGNGLWGKRIGGADSDNAYSVREIPGEGFLVAGWSTSYGNGGADVYLVKTDVLGDTLWTRTYGGTGNEYGHSMELTPDGGCIIAGYAYSEGVTNDDFYLVKTDADGNQEWAQTYGGSGYDSANSVQLTADGGYVMAGYTYSFGAGAADFYLVKTDALGNEEWARTFGGDETEIAYAVRQKRDGGYAIAGRIAPYGEGGLDFYLVITDADGLWIDEYTYGGNDDDVAFDMALTEAGAYVLGGYTKSFGAGSEDSYLVKVEGDPRVTMDCADYTAWLCQGKSFYAKLRVNNDTSEEVSGTLTLSGFSEWGCDPSNIMIEIPRPRSFGPGTTESYYYLDIPPMVAPGQYSISISGLLDDHEVSTCLDTEVIDCQPW
ncbi:MAG: hypothetical protein CL908_23490 [Deltaproteobacteria bacterium]|nr:hypothetical protein [Deltaproteobacteria bacterium]